MAIKIITSSTLSNAMLNAFNAGLAEAGWPGYSVNSDQEDGKYDDTEGSGHQELYQAMTNADHDKNVEVIISAGGLVTAHAAQQSIKLTPFLVLIGQMPKFKLDNAKCCGGVNLDMVRQNIARHDFLVGHYGINKDNVWLIWNSNSKMGKDEKKEWQRNKWPDQEVKNNTEADIAAAFSSLKGAEAVVISGDPYFASHMNQVVTSANTSGLKICYPFSVYANASPPPNKKVSMFYGPDLEFAYRLMGRKAGSILDNKNDPPDTGIDPCPSVGPIFIGG